MSSNKLNNNNNKPEANQVSTKDRIDKWNTVYLFYSVLKMNESQVTTSAWIDVKNKTFSK